MKTMNAKEIASLKVGDSVEIMLRDVAGNEAWYPAVVSRIYHQTLEDYYESDHKVYVPDTVFVTVTVDGRKYPNYRAHEGWCRRA